MSIVCPFVNSIADVQRRASIWTILSGAISVARGNITQPAFDILMGAVMTFCGNDKGGAERIRNGLTALGLGALFLVGYMLILKPDQNKSAGKRKKTLNKSSKY
jgi:hypothetical protein